MTHNTSSSWKPCRREQLCLQPGLFRGFGVLNQGRNSSMVPYENRLYATFSFTRPSIPFPIDGMRSSRKCTRWASRTLLLLLMAVVTLLTVGWWVVQRPGRAAPLQQQQQTPSSLPSSSPGERGKLSRSWNAITSDAHLFQRACALWPTCPKAATVCPSVKKLNVNRPLVRSNRSLSLKKIEPLTWDGSLMMPCLDPR